MLHDSSLMKRHARKGIKTCRYPGLVLDVVHVHLCREFLARYSSMHARACHLFGSVSAQRCSTDAESRGDCAVTSRDCDGGAQYILSARVAQTKDITPQSAQKMYTLDRPGIFDHRIDRVILFYRYFANNARPRAFAAVRLEKIYIYIDFIFYIKFMII